MNNSELTLDQLAEINGGIVDFGGSGFKVSTTVREKGWWTVDGADFKAVMNSKFQSVGLKITPVAGLNFDKGSKLMCLPSCT